MKKPCMRSLYEDERGLTTVEYVIVLCLIAAVSVGLWGELGRTVKTYVSKAQGDIATELAKP